MIISTAKTMAVLLTAFILFGCMTVGPDYTPPEVSAPDGWNTSGDGSFAPAEMDSEALATWWTTLDDPLLSELMERAVAGNLDLKEATARIREARAQRGVSEADLFPMMDASASGQKSRSSKNAGSGKTSRSHRMQAEAGWDLDVFGGVRRSIEAAQGDLEASWEDRYDVLVSLTAELALNYTQVRTLQARLASAQSNLDAQAETLQLVQWRYQSGLTTDLDVQQARYNLESTRSGIPDLRNSLEEAMNRIAVLMGRAPGAVHEELEEKRSIPLTPLEIAVGTPAECLRRRPDVRKAERELAAQTARVGVATAELYPKFSLAGSIGLESLSMGTWLSARSWTYSYGPSLSWPIFHWGAIRQAIEVEDAQQEQALISYESTILTALEEVENALSAYAEEHQKRASLQTATEAAQAAVELALAQYTSGNIDFQDVLDAQKTLFSLQDQLAASEGQVTSNLINLYEALGGGWQNYEPAEKARSDEVGSQT